MAGATGITVEAWIRPAAGSDDWPAANPWTARVTCSGGCECTPSSGTSSGTFSDGPGDYANRQTCKWLIESPGLISLSFASFETVSLTDPVTVNRCTSAACDTVEQVAKLGGLSDCSYSTLCECRLSEPPVSASTVYTSSTGFLQVVFSSNSDACNAPGFVASWNVTSAGQEGAVGFVVAGPTLAVGVLKHRDTLSVLAFRAGPAPVSQCGSQTRLTSSSGVIGDGPFYEPRSESEGSSVCEWIIAPEGARRVTLVFTELSLTGRASTFVQVYRCNTVDCSSRDPLLTVRDTYMPPPVTSDSGVMQVVFQTQYDTRPASPGFTATYAASFEAATLSAGSWQHVAVTVAPDGQRQIFVNGNLSRTDKWPDYGTVALRYDTVAVPNVFDRGGAIGRRSPAWQDKWWNTTTNLGDDEGFFFGTVDELRVWKTVRTGSSLMNQLSSNCSKLLQSETGLVSCFGFDHVSDDGSSFVDEAVPDGDLGVHARPHSGETPHLPWCQGVDDGGKAPLSSTGAPVNGDQLWGFCSVDKPRLPGAGYDYDLTSMTLAASTAAAAESARMLRLHPGCGDVPLIFTDNQASTNGGGVYYDSCPAEGVDCFLQLSTERAAIFERNRAERAGGSVFVDCAVLGSKCTQSFSPQNKLGVLPLPRAEFKDNNAGKYGSNVAVAYPPCVAGKYRLPGAPTCSDCPTNSHSPAGSESMTDCTCNAGFFLDRGGVVCSLCGAGKYKPADAASCVECPPNSQSEMGSYRMTDCVCNTGFSRGEGYACAAVSGAVLGTMYVVKLALLLPFSESEFSADKENKFREAIGAAAGAKPADVMIQKVQATRGRRGSRAGRRLLAESIRVDLVVRATDASAAGDMAATLTVDKINGALDKAGLPKASLLEAPVVGVFDAAALGTVSGTVETDSTNTRSLIGGLAGSFGLLLLLSLAVAILYSRHRAKASKPRKDYIELFNFFDTNKDGRISREEFGTVSSLPFDWIDKDKDGFISRSEFEEAYELVKAFREQEAGRCLPLCLLLRDKYQASRKTRNSSPALKSDPRPSLIISSSLGFQPVHISSSPDCRPGLMPGSSGEESQAVAATDSVVLQVFHDCDIKRSTSLPSSEENKEMKRQMDEEVKILQTKRDAEVRRMARHFIDSLDFEGGCTIKKKVYSEYSLKIAEVKERWEKRKQSQKSKSKDSKVSDQESDNPDEKFVARELVVGDSSLSAAGLRAVIGLHDDAVLGNMMIDPMSTIEMEILVAGSDNDKDNLYSIKDGEAGKWEDIPDHVKNDMANGTYHGGAFTPVDYDTGHAGMRLHDFVLHRWCVMAGLMIYHVLVLRLYSTTTHKLFNAPMRKLLTPGAARLHPLRFTLYILAEALKKLRVVGAQLDPLGFNSEKILWRGMQNMTVDVRGTFMLHGGCEMAVMSTSENRDVAISYARSRKPLVFRYKTVGLNRGVSIQFLSVYPKESEIAFPPLTYLMAHGEIYEEDGVSILDVIPQIS